MSWLYSEALVEEYSADTFSDGEPFAQWNVMPTPQGFWRNDKMMDASRLSQFGPTLRLLTESHGEAVLTSFLAGFPAKTYPQLDEAKESPDQGQVCGLSSLESLAKYDLDTRSWRTPQYSLLGGWELYSETWPCWGMMRNGVCWARSTWAQSMKGTESGLLPTPTAHNSKEGAYPSEYQRNTPTLATHAGGKINPEWTEHLMGWPSKWTDLEQLGMDKFQQWRQEHLLNVYGE